MTSPTPDLAAVTERVAKLEREVLAEKRRTRWLLMVGGLAAGGMVVAWTWANTTATAQAQGTSVGPKVLQANQFIVDDENGKTRAVLAATVDGPGLTIFDQTGKTRVLLGVFKDGPRLSLRDERGETRVVLGELKDGPILTLRDERGETRALMAVTTGGPWVQLLDRDGKKLWSQP